MEIVTFMEGHHLAAFQHLILPVVVVKASVGVDRCQQTLANSVNNCDTVKGPRCLGGSGPLPAGSHWSITVDFGKSHRQLSEELVL